jgi:uncharacterized membrane protein YkvA (DUF1232 family)
MKEAMGSNEQVLEYLKDCINTLQTDTHACYRAHHDLPTPLLAEVDAVSPIDLIRYLLPVPGFLDDLIIVPAGMVFLSGLG